MKKLFTAVPMKKLLLATSIVAMSSTALAANTSEGLDGTVTDTLSVIANYVVPITVGLSLTKIDFGDVYTDSQITPEAVTATVVGEANETFTYTIETDGTLAQIAGIDASGTGIGFGETDDVTKVLSFTIGLDTTKVTSADVDETVTVSVTYDAIADTTVTEATEAT
jgi:hypothetical protein